MPATRMVFTRSMSHVLVGCLSAAVFVVWSATAAFASCAAPPSLESAFEDADVVFMGIVVELSNNDRTARVEVEQVWKGPRLEAVVVVHGGPSEADLFTSVDRTFELGSYIFFPVNASAPFEDNACTLTQRTSEALAVINPFGEEPAEGPAGSGPATTQASFSAGDGGGESTVATEATDPSSAASSGDDSGPRANPWAVGIVSGIAGAIVGSLAWRRRSAG